VIFADVGNCHYTKLQRFSTRSEVLRIADAMLAQIGQAALRA
jgi:hypothetical protein